MKCGTNLPAGTKFCGCCGAKTETPPVYAATQGQSASPCTPAVEALSVGQYIMMLLLMSLPILGIILLFRWSFGRSVNLNKKNMARAYLIFFAVWFIIILVGGGAIMGVLEAIMR